MVHGGARLSDVQKTTYPDIAPTFSDLAPAQAFERAHPPGRGLGRDHARDTVVKLAISELARRHGVAPATLHAEEDDPWAAQVIAALWDLLAAGPHTT